MKITNLKNMAMTLGVFMASGAMALDESELPIGVKHDSTLSPVASNKALVDGSTGPTTTSIRYKNFAASGMGTIYGPQSNDYSYSGGGCMKATAPTTYLGLDNMLDLPFTLSGGSRIVSMTLLANPNSSSDNFNALLFSVDDTGSFGTIASTSISDAGISSFTSQGIFLDYTLLYDTTVMARIEQSGNTGEICGVRIGYISYDVADDVLFSSNFYK